MTTHRHSLEYSLDRFHFSGRQQIALLLCNYIQLVHSASVIAVLVMPWAAPLARGATALALLYLMPPLLARLTMSIRPIREGCIPIASGDYFVWWFLLNLQMVFCRFPFFEECLRVLPGAYSLWLRLWGARIGKYTYWAAGLRILDRSFLEIGDGVIFGAGVHLNPHVIAENSAGDAELLLARIVIGDRAMIGGYSLLTAGTRIAEDETTHAFLKSPPFSHWQEGKRIKKGRP